MKISVPLTFDDIKDVKKANKNRTKYNRVTTPVMDNIPTVDHLSEIRKN